MKYETTYFFLGIFIQSPLNLIKLFENDHNRCNSHGMFTNFSTNFNVIFALITDKCIIDMNKLQCIFVMFQREIYILNIRKIFD